MDLDGLELEGEIAATDNLTFDFSAGNVDSLVLDPCANSGEFLFPGPVEDSYSIGARWLKPLDSGAAVTFWLSYAYTGPQQTHPGGTTNTCFNPVTGAPNPVPGWFFDSRYELPDYASRQRARTLHERGRELGAHAVREQSHGRGLWQLCERASAAASGIGGSPVSIAAPQRSALGITLGRPREVGVTFQYNFGGDGAGSR